MGPKVNNNKLRVSVVYPNQGADKNIGNKGYSIQKSTSLEVGFLGYGEAVRVGNFLVHNYFTNLKIIKGL